MKRLFLYLVVGVSLLATSCNLFNSDDDTDYEKVYYGLRMYLRVELTNNYAMDGVNVAMRLAILLSEMENAGLEFREDGGEPDWTQLGDVTVSGLSYNKKVFLFGSSTDVQIAKSGDNYYIMYGANGLHTAGYKDTAYRIGKYCVNTAGNTNISDSSSSSKWSVYLMSDMVSFAASKNDVWSVYECKGWSGEIWNNGSGELAYSVSDVGIYIVDEDDREAADSDKTYCNWGCEGTISIPNVTNLTIEDTMYEDVYLDITSAGGTAYTLDTYEYYTSSPLVYNFNKGANLKYGGVEELQMIGGSLSCKTATIESASDGLQTIYYNGASYIYDDEYLYYYYYDDYLEDEEDEESDYIDSLDDDDE